MRRGAVGKGDLERERDERVGERHEEVGEHGSRPAHKDELPELDGRVGPAGRDELEVDGQEEGEAEEGDDDEVDEADGDGRGGDGGAEGPETVHGEADGRAEGLRGGLQVRDRDAGVLQHGARPHLAELGGDFGLEFGQGGKDV